MIQVAIEVSSTLQWTATQTALGTRWMATCEPLGISVEGESLDEVHGLIPEACFVLFTDLIEDNEFDEFLTARGWRSRNQPTGSVDEEIEFLIPWNLVAEGKQRDSTRSTH